MADQNLNLPAAMFRSGTTVKTTEARMARVLKGVVNVDLEYTEVGQHAMFEGDIVLATLDEVKAAEQRADSKGIGIVGENFRWPGGKVPFAIANEAVRARVTTAIEHWQARTPFQFIPRTQEADFLSFDALDGCFSRVGRQGGMQVVSIGTDCGIGSAIHEIGHSIGLWHEQSRSDRDNFIQVVLANVDPRFRSNFAKHIQDGEDLGPYDHGSIMHYPPTAFSINGQPTILTRNGESIGQRNGLSKGDVAAVRLMYANLDWTRFPDHVKPRLEGRVVIPASVPAFFTGALRVWLEDVSYADRAATVIGEATMADVSHAPKPERDGRPDDTVVPFEVQAVHDIDPAADYSVRVSLEVSARAGQEALVMESDRSYPVFTRGHGSSVTVVLETWRPGTGAI